MHNKKDLHIKDMLDYYGIKNQNPTSRKFDDAFDDFFDAMWLKGDLDEMSPIEDIAEFTETLMSCRNKLKKLGLVQ